MYIFKFTGSYSLPGVFWLVLYFEQEVCVCMLKKFPL
jgi:hypothetical protein